MITLCFKDSACMAEVADETVQLAVSSLESMNFTTSVPQALRDKTVNEARSLIKQMAKNLGMGLGEYLLKSAPEALKAQYRKSMLEIERVLKKDGLFFLEIGYPIVTIGDKDLFTTDFKTLYPYLIAADVLKETNLKLRDDLPSRISFKLAPIPPYEGNIEQVKNVLGKQVFEHWFMFSKTKHWKNNREITLPPLLEGTSEIIQWLWKTEYNETEQKAVIHVTEARTSPQEILTLLIKKFSDENDLILDAFAGSGTLGILAEKYGRNCVLYERKQKRFVLAKHRLDLANCIFQEIL